MGWNKALLLAATMAVVLSTGCDSSTAVNNTQPESIGKRLFEENCAGCHGMTGHGNPIMLQGKAIHFDDPTFQKMLSDETITQTIKNGRGMMPSFDTTFTDDEIKELVSYLRSLPGQSSSQK